jgi:hypothetical protein
MSIMAAFPVRAKLVEALLFLLSPPECEGQPFDRLRANGGG